jgi:all-trans-retinol 13,14-reductase
LIEDNHVVGVESKKGRWYAPVVISNVDPRVTYEQLIGLEKLPTPFMEQVQNLRPSMSLISWVAALEQPFAFHQLITQCFSQPIEFPLNQITAYGFGIHSSASQDPTLVPTSGGNVLMYFRTSPKSSFYTQMNESDYFSRKREIDFVCRSLLLQIDPAAAKAILFTEVATPKTYEYYLKTYEGSIYSTVIDQANHFPAIETPIFGLYLASAGVGCGPGVEAAVITGALASAKILEY